MLAATHLVDCLRLFFYITDVFIITYLERRAQLFVFSVNARNIIFFFNVDIRKWRITICNQYLTLPIWTLPVMFLIICISHIDLGFDAAIFQALVHRGVWGCLCLENLLSSHYSGHLDICVTIVHIYLRSHHVGPFAFKTRCVARRAMLLYILLDGIILIWFLRSWRRRWCKGLGIKFKPMLWFWNGLRH